jgi:GTPase SAR1 family protein
MSIINYAQKEISFKIVYYGTGVAGKTANLQYIYRGLPDVNRGNMVSLATGDDRTLFFDFLPVSGSRSGTSWRSSSSTRCRGRCTTT